MTEMLFFRANLLELYFFFFGIVCTLLSLKSKSSPWLSIISIVVVNVIVSEEHLHNCGVSGILSIQALLPLTLSLQIYILFIRALAIYAHVRLVLNVHIIMRVDVHSLFVVITILPSLNRRQRYCSNNLIRF